VIEKIFVFIFGAVIGSFLNVCIHRMPSEGYSLVSPGSHCPNCKKPILWYDNVPLLSYIVLGGKCRFCRQRISFRYFVVELLTAVTFLFLYNRFGASYNFFFCALFLCGLIVATFIDMQHRIIPDEISLGGILAGFILRTASGIGISPLTLHPRPMVNSLLGIIVGGGVIFLTGFIFDLIYFKLLKRPAVQGETQSMGDGDVKLLAMIGAFLGWERALLTFFIAPFFGAVIGFTNLIIKKDHTIPYGPFLSLGAVLSLFWADKIIGFFLHLY
jgi:leader peptidase (prepilin peptidase) / N-methyltransferase